MLSFMKIPYYIGCPVIITVTYRNSQNRYDQSFILILIICVYRKTMKKTAANLLRQILK